MTDAAELRERAHEILSEQRFHERKSPAPLRGVFRWLGDRLAPALEPIGRFYAWVVDLLDDTITRVVFVSIVVLMVVLISRAVIRRRSAVALRGGAKRTRGQKVDPAELERDANRAEGTGDFERAIRLRFRAGVIRLQLAGRVRSGDTMATRAIGAHLQSADFDALGETFDAVAYGGAPADDHDARASREAWERVLSEAPS